MSQYYLMSQLPALDGLADGAPLPITEERFLELCERFLPQKMLEALKGLTLVPPIKSETTGFKLIDEWNLKERSLRLALARVRAEKWGKAIPQEEGFIPSEMTALARVAAEIDNPLEAESFLDGFRAQLLEALRPMDAFCEDAVFYYGLKLKLTARIRLFDKEKGKRAYRDIYNSIMSQESREAKQ